MSRISALPLLTDAKVEINNGLIGYNAWLFMLVSEFNFSEAEARKILRNSKIPTVSDFKSGFLTDMISRERVVFCSLSHCGGDQVDLSFWSQVVEFQFGHNKEWREKTEKYLKAPERIISMDIHVLRATWGKGEKEMNINPQELPNPIEEIGKNIFFKKICGYGLNRGMSSRCFAPELQNGSNSVFNARVGVAGIDDLDRIHLGIYLTGSEPCGNNSGFERIQKIPDGAMAAKQELELV